MSINLIPGQLKKEKDLKFFLGQAVFAVSAIFIMLVLLAGAFYAYNTYLADDIKNMDARISDANAQIPSYKETEQKIETINSKLSKIDSTSGGQVLWSEILQAIAGATPKNAQIKNLTLDQNAKTVLLVGTAASRKDIALMKEKLETIGSFSNVTFTTSSFNAASNDYSFSLNFDINPTKK